MQSIRRYDEGGPPGAPGAPSPDAGGVSDTPGTSPVRVDCDHCSVRGVGCDDCVVTFLLGEPPGDTDFDAEEHRALHVLAEGGLLPPLRMVRPVDGRVVEGA